MAISRTIRTEACKIEILQDVQRLREKVGIPWGIAQPAIFAELFLLQLAGFRTVICQVVVGEDATAPCYLSGNRFSDSAFVKSVRSVYCNRAIGVGEFRVGQFVARCPEGSRCRRQSVHEIERTQKWKSTEVLHRSRNRHRDACIYLHTVLCQFDGWGEEVFNVHCSVTPQDSA